MRIASCMLLCAIVLSTGCKSKTGLTDDEKQYVHTTVDLMRARASLKPGMDSVQANQILNAVYQLNKTTKKEYLTQTEKLGDDPKRTELVYNAIRDSSGVK